MAKLISLYSGFNSHGDLVEVAQREDGKWFCRYMEDKGRYGKGMCKWLENEEPEFETHVTNAYSGERTELDDKTQFISWGFNRLERHKELPRYRLPND